MPSVGGAESSSISILIGIMIYSLSHLRGHRYWEPLSRFLVFSHTRLRQVEVFLPGKVVKISRHRKQVEGYLGPRAGFHEKFLSMESTMIAEFSAQVLCR